MLRTAALIAVVLAVAIGGGAASVWYALETSQGVAALRIGPWSAYPDIGTPDASPYAKAAVARDGELTLGRAEGLSFTATHDSGGQPLLARCTYRMAGRMPPARFWTLFAADRSMAPLSGAAGERPAALHSGELIYDAGDRFVIIVSPRPAPRNWLRVAGAGNMALVLSLYETPVANSTGIAHVELPGIERVACDG